MKKLLLTVIVLSLSCSPVLAEQNISVKVGWINQLCKNIKDSPVIAVAYEICNKWLGVEMETSVFTTDIPQVERLYVSSISLIPKIYIKNFYFGPKAGYAFTYVKNMDADDEVIRGGVVGWKFNNGLFFEVQRDVADFDIETFLPYETSIEEHSRLDNWKILIGKKWKF